MEEGGVGRRGAVWPTTVERLATATAGAASVMADISSGIKSTREKTDKVIRSTLTMNHMHHVHVQAHCTSYPAFPYSKR